MRASLLLLVAMLAACSSHDAEVTSNETPEPAMGAAAAPVSEALTLGLWRATVTLPTNAELPFGLEIARDNGRYTADLINGTERVRVPEMTVKDGRIEILMPGLASRIQARILPTGLDGELVLVGHNDQQQVLPLTATAGEDFRFEQAPLTDNADVSGRWNVTFERDGESSAAIAEFEQRHHSVQGTFVTPLADFRYLAGDVRDDLLQLSSFDGSRASLCRGRIDREGEMAGDCWTTLDGVQHFSAHRDDAAELTESAVTTQVRADAPRFNFTFPDLDGKPVSLTDQRFAGKVVLVVIGSSWCANCRDQAEFLTPWLERNRSRGLEVIALMFEHESRFVAATTSVQNFRQQFGITYPTLLAGKSGLDDASAALPQLTGVYTFPTTLFIDRQGRMRRIHMGFLSAAAAERQRQVLEEFDTITEQLLNESGSVLNNAPNNTPSGT